MHRSGGARKPRLAGMRSSLSGAAVCRVKTEIGRLIYRIESLGCILKDIDLGLIDFPSMREDEPILLMLEARRAQCRTLARRRGRLQRPKAAVSSVLLPAAAASASTWMKSSAKPWRRTSPKSAVYAPHSALVISPISGTFASCGIFARISSGMRTWSPIASAFDRRDR